jgi:hypothetical protein
MSNKNNLDKCLNCGNEIINIPSVIFRLDRIKIDIFTKCNSCNEGFHFLATISNLEFISKIKYVKQK